MGIGYVVFSIICGVFFAMLVAMLASSMPYAAEEQIEFGPNFWNALPTMLVWGFILSPLCLLCARGSDFLA